MGAPDKSIQASEQAVASEALFSPFKTIGDEERGRHSAVYDYWLALRGNREFPSIRDLDPLQISDAGPCSILLELISGGEDAEIRHIGETLKADVKVVRIAEASRSSLLSCIASKLAIVAISRDALAFEDDFKTDSGTTSCRVTLLPFSSTGPWVDYVYGFVTSENAPSEVEQAPETVANDVEEVPEPVEERVEETPEPGANEVEEAPEPLANEAETAAESAPEPVEPALESPVASEGAAASSKGFDPLAGVEGFFGTVVNLELEPAPPVADKETAAEEDPQHDTHKSENPMQTRLVEVRAKADEARIAKLQSEAALHEGLSAAYDFALDAEDKAEDYLKLVETKGLKIQLRSPMAPVVRLAFDGRCDDRTIAELEGVMAWALRANLPRGSLAERIQAEGGIAAILNGPARGE